MRRRGRPGKGPGRPQSSARAFIAGGAWCGDDASSSRDGGGAVAASGTVATSDSLFVFEDGATFVADESRAGLVRCDADFPIAFLVPETDLEPLLAVAAPGEPVAIPAVGDNPTTRFFRIKIQIALP